MRDPEPLSVRDLAPSPPAPDPIEPGPGRRALLLVFLVVFIDLLGFGIVLPLLPIYGDAYLGALIPGGKEAALGGVVLGALMASFSLMQFVFAPVWGRVSDRIGRRPILLLGLAGSAGSYAVLGYASNLPAAEAAGLALGLLFAARLGAGVAGATIGTAQAVIADCTPPERRKHGMALIGAAFGIGFTFGPLVGFAALTWFPGYLGATGYAAALLSLAALLLGLALLPETRRFGSAPPLERKWFDGRAWRVVLRDPALAPVVLAFFLASLGFGSFEVTLGLLNRDALRLADRHNFLVFAYVGFVLLLTQGFLYRRLARRVSEPTFIAVGICLMALGVAALGGVTWLAYAAAAGFGTLLGLELAALAVAVVGFAFLTPSAQALVSRRTPADRQGEILGVNQSAAAVARILGPVLGLTLYKQTPSHLLPYVFGAGLLLLMLPLLPRIRRG
jgi:DHA1 family tetracycline resistance protein-like MFS transporter